MESYSKGPMIAYFMNAMERASSLSKAASRAASEAEHALRRAQQAGGFVTFHDGDANYLAAQDRWWELFQSARDLELIVEAFKGMRVGWKTGKVWRDFRGDFQGAYGGGYEDGPAWFMVSRLMRDLGGSEGPIAMAPLWPEELVEDLEAARDQLKAHYKDPSVPGRLACHYWLRSLEAAVRQPCDACGASAYVIAHDHAHSTYDGDEAQTDVYALCVGGLHLTSLGGWHHPPCTGWWQSVMGYEQQVAYQVANWERRERWRKEFQEKAQSKTAPG